MNSNSTEPGQIRKFGASALVFFGILSSIGFWRGSPIPTYLFGFLSLLGLGFVLLPTPLRPVYKGWMGVAHAMGRVITTLMLTLAYYLVITPSGLLKRLISGSPIPGAPDSSATSYWVARPEPAQPREQFFKRF